VHATGCRQLRNRWNWTFCIHAAQVLHPFSVGGAYHRLEAVEKPMKLDVFASAPQQQIVYALACCWCAPPTGCRRLNNRWNLDFCPRPCGPYMT
jgi:hypothetical protein